ncbi:putative transposase [Orientia tsutsugamushi str. UT76]|nr:putative transposase [Orientia tsutsugamushi str. UT76]
MVDKKTYQVICTDFSNGKNITLDYLRNPKFLFILKLKRLLIQDIKVYKKFTIILNYQRKKARKILQLKMIKRIIVG